MTKKTNPAPAPAKKATRKAAPKKAKAAKPKVDRGETKPAARPKAKPAIGVAKVAELRRAGATWAEVDEAAGFKAHKTSTWWGRFLAEAGYDRAGRKDGQGASKAKAFGPNLLK
ncbi:MAG: hypothetical protein ACRDMH_13240 [Solirubrobacterales bacterium]